MKLLTVKDTFAGKLKKGFPLIEKDALSGIASAGAGAKAEAPRQASQAARCRYLVRQGAPRRQGGLVHSVVHQP